MELKDTIGFMTSEDYKNRFVAEYMQTKIRAEKLQSVVNRYDRGELDFKLNCPIELLKRQLRTMREYLLIMDCRADMEGVDLL